MNERHVTDQGQLLADLARAGAEDRQEASVVVSPGAGATAWAVKVTSHAAYNIYNVRAVAIGAAGSAPTEMGEPMQATNLAESFLSQGSLAPGTYALMCRVGDNNVFYAAP